MTRDLKEIVSERLTDLKRNPFEAARIGGLERSFVNDILIGKKSSVRGQNLAKLAVGLDMSLPDLLNSDGADASWTTIVVRGLIGAGAEILMDAEQVGPEGLEEVEIAISVNPDAMAFRVQGDSMWPRYDAGDIVICGREGTSVDEIVNWEAAVRTGDGRRFLKRIRQGSKKGLFDLESHNASPIRDVTIEWASEIAYVVRAGQWRSVSPAERARRAKKRGQT